MTSHDLNLILVLALQREDTDVEQLCLRALNGEEGAEQDLVNHLENV